MFWRKFSEAWLSGIVTGLIFTLLGAYIGWKISYDDTQAQIAGLRDANRELQAINQAEQQANRRLEDQARALEEQKAAGLAQANRLTGIVSALAAQGHDLKLALDNRGNVTLGGHAIVDSRGGAILTTESGIPIVTESGVPIVTGSSRLPAVSPGPAKKP